MTHFEVEVRLANSSAGPYLDVATNNGQGPRVMQVENALLITGPPKLIRKWSLGGKVGMQEQHVSRGFEVLTGYATVATRL